MRRARPPGPQDPPLGPPRRPRAPHAAPRPAGSRSIPGCAPGGGSTFPRTASPGAPVPLGEIRRDARGHTHTRRPPGSPPRWRVGATTRRTRTGARARGTPRRARRTLRTPHAPPRPGTRRLGREGHRPRGRGPPPREARGRSVDRWMGGGRVANAAAPPHRRLPQPPSPASPRSRALRLAWLRGGSAGVCGGGGVCGDPPSPCAPPQPQNASLHLSWDAGGVRLRTNGELRWEGISLPNSPCAALGAAGRGSGDGDGVAHSRCPFPESQDHASHPGLPFACKSAKIGLILLSMVQTPEHGEEGVKGRGIPSPAHRSPSTSLRPLPSACGNEVARAGRGRGG